MRKTLAAFLLGLIVGVGCGALWLQRRAAIPRFNTPFQAVLLDTGQVYYGRIEGAGTPYPVLREVYYVQSRTDAQTKQLTNILIRRGREWHGPESTTLNARHIVMIEPIDRNSKVAQLITEQQKSK